MFDLERFVSTLDANIFPRCYSYYIWLWRYSLCYICTCLVWNKQWCRLYHVSLHPYIKRSADIHVELKKEEKKVWMKRIDTQFDSWWCKVCNCRRVSASRSLHVRTRPAGQRRQETGCLSHTSLLLLRERETETHLFEKWIITIHFIKEVPDGKKKGGGGYKRKTGVEDKALYLYTVFLKVWWEGKSAQGEQESKRRERKEREVESCLSVSDLLSLAEFRTKFTSFHDIAKAQLSVKLPGQNTQDSDR